MSTTVLTNVVAVGVDLFVVVVEQTQLTDEVRVAFVQFRTRVDDRSRLDSMRRSFFNDANIEIATTVVDVAKRRDGVGLNRRHANQSNGDGSENNNTSCRRHGDTKEIVWSRQRLRRE